MTRKLPVNPSLFSTIWQIIANQQGVIIIVGPAGASTNLAHTPELYQDELPAAMEIICAKVEQQDINWRVHSQELAS